VDVTTIKFIYVSVDLKLYKSFKYVYRHNTLAVVNFLELVHYDNAIIGSKINIP
jgi:hypothetical protein